MSFSYDRLAYPTVPRLMSHPGHLNAVARLFGVPTEPVEQSRVLEIGCGDGMHLLACAAAMPDATFVGIDLSAAAIARGRQLAADAGLSNVELRVEDINSWQTDASAFHYVIADGIYSWIPGTIRDSLMKLIANSLAPTGLAFVSYNVYPGCYTRRMLWEMMNYHVAGIDEPEQMIDEALRMADFIRTSRNKSAEAKLGLFDRDLDLVLNRRDRNILYHDELSPVNDPIYFHQFADHSMRNDLVFLSESLPQSMGISTLPGPVVERIDAFSEGDRLKREQYIDFATLRRFRQSILAPAGSRINLVPDSTAIRGLHISALGEFASDPMDWNSDTPLTIRLDGNEIKVRTPLTKAAFSVLESCKPHRLSFDELLSRSLAKLNHTAHSPLDESILLDDLRHGWALGAIGLKGFQPRYATSISERPVASRLAQAQLRHGPLASSLLHTTIRFDDPPSRMLVQLLDGSRSVDSLASEILPLFPAEMRPSPAEFQVGLARNLAMLLHGGYLVA